MQASRLKVRHSVILVLSVPNRLTSIAGQTESVAGHSRPPSQQPGFCLLINMKSFFAPKIPCGFKVSKEALHSMGSKSICQHPINSYGSDYFV